jgi:TetR/AcrR family transcriptional regulator, regulator of biofilm formation and stress response
LTARRDPAGRRRAIIDAAAALVAEVGVDGLTHRLVAARAGVPLGATTYYFATLDDLRLTTLSHVCEINAAYLRSWAEAIRASADVAATLAELTADYLADRSRALADTELYLAAIRRPELRPQARIWFDGLVALLSERSGPAAATAAAYLIDGAIIRALSDQRPLAVAALATSLRALLGGENTYHG